MNTKNNKRRRNSQEKMEKAFVELLQKKEINEISVTEICQKTNLNRSTFYANYIDIYDLADKLKEKLEQEVTTLYQEEREQNFNSNDYLKLFQHIKENQIFYKTYFKLGYDNKYQLFQYDKELAKKYFNNQYIDYHITFFKNGLNAIIKSWLQNGCQEPPEVMIEILKSEYQNRHSF